MEQLCKEVDQKLRVVNKTRWVANEIDIESLNTSDNLNKSDMLSNYESVA